MATILRGNPYANLILEQCKTDIARLVTSGIQPGLAFVLVGDDLASKIYVGRNKKRRTCWGFALICANCRRRRTLTA